jgi:hypothetical protein
MITVVIIADVPVDIMSPTSSRTTVITTLELLLKRHA